MSFMNSSAKPTVGIPNYKQKQLTSNLTYNELVTSTNKLDVDVVERTKQNAQNFLTFVNGFSLGELGTLLVLRTGHTHIQFCIQTSYTLLAFANQRLTLWTGDTY